MSPELTTDSFPAMGGSVEVQIAGGDAAAPVRVRALFAQCEEAMSRFLAGSELSALNATAGWPFPASPLLFAVLEQALFWARETNGVFDPTMLDLLEGLGYDRRFEEVGLGGRAPRSAASTVRQRPAAARWREIRLDRERRTVTLAPGVRLDLGGIGKGFTVDRAVEALGGTASAMVNASGDLYARGAGPNGDGWRVGVQSPLAPETDLFVLKVRDRGVATSGSVKRWWDNGDSRYHHLIDPVLGTSAGSDLLAVTVIATTATQADVMAKTAYILGSAGGMRMIERRTGCEAVAVSAAGEVLTTSGLGRYVA